MNDSLTRAHWTSPSRSRSAVNPCFPLVSRLTSPPHLPVTSSHEIRYVINRLKGNFWMRMQKIVYALLTLLASAVRATGLAAGSTVNVRTPLVTVLAFPTKSLGGACHDCRGIEQGFRCHFGVRGGEVAFSDDGATTGAVGASSSCCAAVHGCCPDVPFRALPCQPLGAASGHGGRIPTIRFLRQVGMRRCNRFRLSHLSPFASTIDRRCYK